MDIVQRQREKAEMEQKITDLEAEVERVTTQLAYTTEQVYGANRENADLLHQVCELRESRDRLRRLVHYLMPAYEARLYRSMASRGYPEKELQSIKRDIHEQHMKMLRPGDLDDESSSTGSIWITIDDQLVYVSVPQLNREGLRWLVDPAVKAADIYRIARGVGESDTLIDDGDVVVLRNGDAFVSIPWGKDRDDD